MFGLLAVSLQVLSVGLEEEIQNSFMQYAMSIILVRQACDDDTTTVPVLLLLSCAANRKAHDAYTYVFFNAFMIFP